MCISHLSHTGQSLRISPSHRHPFLASFATSFTSGIAPMTLFGDGHMLQLAHKYESGAFNGRIEKTRQ